MGVSDRRRRVRRRTHILETTTVVSLIVGQRSSNLNPVMDINIPLKPFCLTRSKPELFIVFRKIYAIKIYSMNRSILVRIVISTTVHSKTAVLTT